MLPSCILVFEALIARRTTNGLIIKVTDLLLALDLLDIEIISFKGLTCLYVDVLFLINT